MTWGVSTDMFSTDMFLKVHVALSLVGIAPGLVMLSALLTASYSG
jgi:hypothetical protein